MTLDDLREFEKLYHMKENNVQKIDWSRPITYAGMPARLLPGKVRGPEGCLNVIAYLSTPYSKQEYVVRVDDYGRSSGSIKVKTANVPLPKKRIERWAVIHDTGGCSIHWSAAAAQYVVQNTATPTKIIPICAEFEQKEAGACEV